MREEEKNPRALHAQVGKEVSFAKKAWKMPTIITEDDSGYCDPWIAKTTSTSSGNSDAESPSNAGRNKVSAEEASWMRSEMSSKKTQKVQLPLERNTFGSGGIEIDFVSPTTMRRMEDVSHSRSTLPALWRKKSEGHIQLTPAVILKAKNIAIVLGVVAAILILATLTVFITKPCLPCHSTVSAACPDFWIGYNRKCFYASKEEKNWSLSLKTCFSLNASLAVIDTQKELDFWVEIFTPFHYWFGLSREINQFWKWFNDTEFKNQFAVRGEGFCAYVDGKGASSTMCSMEKHFLCSRPESCSKSG